MRGLVVFLSAGGIEKTAPRHFVLSTLLMRSPHLFQRGKISKNDSLLEK